MASKGFVQQRPVFTREELRAELELLLTEDVAVNKSGELDPAQLRRASHLVDKLLVLFDRYTGAGV